ncbi:MAG: polyprenyl synthetase family protein [Bacteroidales bacterium]|jgi:geranylgeranyl diphosphate synthase type II|nr:polyprenyl synthetase family protein [Bacteroidales bacterium]NCU35143.1 polyprenyl synthetase family protein [Candidatus Falkowbacteria bacterium]MDD3527237.1 polyprenyl synthetase family protein [Bacteroidales bacterium]MDD4175983.1 polyprenyl synthetase family protein [Bacteroidales bacterium]MDD4741555.1 polyprenyl synthetase family protein [Bacteroidales bacterium]
MEQFANFKNLVNEALQKADFGGRPDQLYQPIRYTMDGEGKRLRPVLMLAACDLFGGEPEKILEAAIGIELFHNFTLLHDDIMDNAKKRRGKDTVHRKWDNNTAILSGDTMFALAYRWLLKAKHPQIAEMLGTFTQTAIEVCEGQHYDMDFEKSPAVTIAEYLNMIRLKTAVLLGCSVKIGALAANASPRDVQLIYDFGVNIGIAFQLQDDLLDTFGDAEKTGKAPGGDILANKKTYLFLKCLETADAADRQKLLGFYTSNTNHNPQQKIDEVRGLMQKYDTEALAQQEMEQYYATSLHLLNLLYAPREKIEAMLAYAQWLYRRDH